MKTRFRMFCGILGVFIFLSQIGVGLALLGSNNFPSKIDQVSSFSYYTVSRYDTNVGSSSARIDMFNRSLSIVNNPVGNDSYTINETWITNQPNTYDDVSDKEFLYNISQTNVKHALNEIPMELHGNWEQNFPNISSDRKIGYPEAAVVFGTSFSFNITFNSTNISFKTSVGDLDVTIAHISGLFVQGCG